VGGDKPLGLAIAAIVLVVLAGMPIAVVMLFYTFANVVAIVTGSDFGSDTVNVPVLLAGLAVIVATGVLSMAAGVSLVGRTLSPKRKRG
jgi:hypothetical protein